MNNSYEAEVFLNRLYKDLHTSEIVKHSSDISDNKNEKVHKYMQRLERTHVKKYLNYLKKLYYVKYVIKEEDIPEYVDKKEIIFAQKESLDKWLDYLLDDSTRYPIWAKYWAFQGMLRIGTYNEENDIYMKRTKKTVAPFIEADPECIAKCIDMVSKYIHKEGIDDDNLKTLIESGNFGKLYTLLLKKRKEVKRGEDTEGKWIKYNYKSEEDALRLYESLQGYSTHWCTASASSIAINQVCGGGGYSGGDFYVYYTKDEEEKFVVPRIAMRMMGNLRIGEIRGVADESQNLEDGFEDVIKEKLESMGNVDKEDIKKYILATEDKKTLTRLNKKNTDFTNEELRFIFELDRKIETFGWGTDSRIDKVRSRQKIKDDAFAIEAIKINPIAINYVDPLSVADYDKIALIAVRSWGGAILLIKPEYIKDYNKIALEAVKQEPMVISNINPARVTNYDEIAMEVIKKDGYFIKYIKPENVSNYDELLKIATKFKEEKEVKNQAR